MIERKDSRLSAAKLIGPLRARTQNALAPKEWVIGPALDLIFGCGLAVWLLYGLHRLFEQQGVSGRAHMDTLIGLTIIGAHTLGETHQAATLVRLYSKDESRKKYFLQSYWSAAVLLAWRATGIAF